MRQAIPAKVLAELKQTFLEAYDENSDGKIDIREVSKVFADAGGLFLRRLRAARHSSRWRRRRMLAKFKSSATLDNLAGGWLAG